MRRISTRQPRRRLRAGGSERRRTRARGLPGAALAASLALLGGGACGARSASSTGARAGAGGAGDRATGWRARVTEDEGAPAWAASPASDDRYFVGSWRARDDDGWIYLLEVYGDMSFVEWIDRPDGTDCVQRGRLWVEGSDLFWYYEVNTCNGDYQGRSDPDPIVNAELDAFTIDLDDYTLVYRRLGAGLDW